MSNIPVSRAEYTEYFNDVTMVNNVYKGSKYANTYLKQFLREDDTDFKDRKQVATIDNYVSKTIEGIKNIIFRKSIDLSNIKNKDLLSWLENDVDLNGNDINDFAKKLTVNIAKDGFTYLLVDAPKANPDIITKRDEQLAKIRPYFINIKRLDLINWNIVNGEYEFIVFNESYVVRNGLFGVETKQQLKAMFNDGRTIVFRDGAIYEDYQREVKEITIVKIDDKDVPPFLDMAKLNIEQMNRKSEKQNYVRIGAAPFPIFYGTPDSNAAKTLSITQGLRFNSKTENGFEWAEMSGSNFNIIKDDIEALNLEMEKIGVSFVSNMDTKTATQVNKESMENESKLSDYALKIEAGINKALDYVGYYNANIKDQYITVNKDFDSNILTPEQVAMYQQLRINGDISWELFMELLIKGEVIGYLDEKQLQTESVRRLNEGLADNANNL